jgi:hypothetical protein
MWEWGASLARVPIRVILVKLRPGADRQAYEAFIREVDYPVAATRRSIPYYRNHHIRPDTWEPAPAEWDYVEYIQVTDVDEYTAERASKPNAEFVRRNPEFVERTLSFWADVVQAEPAR